MTWHDVVLFMFAEAIADAMSRGKLGPGGCSEWRDGQVVIWAIGHELRSRAYTKGILRWRADMAREH